MKRLFAAAAAAATLLLGGCATTIRSDVTTFHEWPATIADKSYVFEAPPAPENTLEMRSYQGLVRQQLARLGFQEAAATASPNLKVSMRFMTTDVPVRVLQPMMATSMYYSSARFGHPMFRPYWGPRRYWGGWYSPFYDPFWHGMPMYTEAIEHYYKRELQVAIKTAADNRRLFDVTVDNTSKTRSTPMIMPALVQSAFAEFPGVSGVARRIELKREN